MFGESPTTGNSPHPAASACCHTLSRPLHTCHSTHWHTQSFPACRGRQPEGRSWQSESQGTHIRLAFSPNSSPRRVNWLSLVCAEEYSISSIDVVMLTPHDYSGAFQGGYSVKVPVSFKMPRENTKQCVSLGIRELVELFRKLWNPQLRQDLNWDRWLAWLKLHDIVSQVWARSLVLFPVALSCLSCGFHNFLNTKKSEVMIEIIESGQAHMLSTSHHIRNNVSVNPKWEYETE